MHTEVSSVQVYGQFANWPDHVRYVGMPGNASRAFGIPDRISTFGKPWALKHDPRGWAAGYAEYVAGRLQADGVWADWVTSLHGKTLLCWCTAKQATRGTEVPCHARILAEYVEMLFHAHEAPPAIE